MIESVLFVTPKSTLLPLAQSLKDNGYRPLFTQNHKRVSLILREREIAAIFIYHTDSNHSLVIATLVQCRLARSQPAILVLTETKEPALLRELFITGAHDVLFFPVGEMELQRCFFRALQICEREEFGTRDPLTRLYNRYSFQELLKTETERAHRYGRPLSLLMADIDHFKKVNDIIGHLKGDEVLKMIAQTIAASVRKSDYVTRYGGEEFTIILPETTVLQAQTLAERLRLTVEQLDFHHLGYSFPITISIGISNCHAGDTVGIETHLVSHADEALYSAKFRGRNQVQV